MAKFFISIYDFFKTHRSVYYLILISTFVCFAYFGLKIELEEDIAKLLPSTENTAGSEKLVFSDLKVKDKIFVLFHSKNEDSTTDELIGVCDEFAESLLNADSANLLIGDFLYQLDLSMLQNASGYILKNIPVFVEKTCYPLFDSLLQPEQIEKQMAENYRMLMSPIGMEYSEMIQYDPAALRNALLKQFDVDEMGSDFTIIDGHFFAPDSSMIIAFLSPNFASLNSKVGNEFFEMLDKQAAQFRTQYPDIEFLYHGEPVETTYNARQVKSDLVKTLSISLLIVFVFILLCFKNKSTIALLISPILYGAIFALAVIYLIKGSISLMALGIGAIVLGVALSYCLHVLTHYKYVSDPKIVLKDQSVPVILGCLTTIGSFAGLLLTKSDLLRDFGMFASLALVGTTVFSLVFLPQMFQPERNRKSEKAFAFLEKINSYPFENKKWIVVFILIVSLVCVYTSRWVTFDSDLRNLAFKNPMLERSKTLYAEKTTNGNIANYFGTTSKNLDSALIYTNVLYEKLEELKETGKIKSFSKSSMVLIPQSEQLQRIEQWKTYWTEDRCKIVMNNIEQIGAEFDFRPETFEPFKNMILSDYQPFSILDTDMLPEALLSNFIEKTNDSYIVFTSVQIPKENLKEASDIIASTPNCLVIDPFYYTNDMVRAMNDDYNKVLWIAMAFVFIVLLISFRNLKWAILAFIPMILSWYIVLGIMGIFGLQFNLINIVISTFIFGIGVDYSIFIMDGLIAGKSNSNSQLIMYHKTAIFFSAIVLIITVSSLFFAVHPAVKSVALSTLIGMTSAVLISYTFQPCVFKLLSKKSKK